MYRAADQVNGIDIEILPSQNIYLTVHTQQIPPYKDSSTALLYINSDPFTIHRHQGGQRLLLTPDASAHLLSLLASPEPITLRLQGFTTQVTTTDFKPFSRPPLPNPFHLPF